LLPLGLSLSNLVPGISYIFTWNEVVQLDILVPANVVSTYFAKIELGSIWTTLYTQPICVCFAASNCDLVPSITHFSLPDDDERNKRQKRLKSEETLSETWKMEEHKYRDGEYSSSHSSPESVVIWSDEDSKLLETINEAFNPMYEQTVIDDGLIPHPTTVDIVNMADISVRRLIKVAKGLEIFIKLSISDQIELLKHCAIEMLILLSAPTFDTKTSSWEPAQKPEAKVHIDEVQNEGNEQMMEMMAGYGRYSVGLNQIMEGDKNILHLLGVICLFSTDQIQMQSKQQVEAVQERFACLLERYVKKERPGINLFPRLIMKLSDLKHLKDQHAKLLSSVEVHAIAPLLKELFNL
jgi:hypothetical protein